MNIKFPIQLEHSYIEILKITKGRMILKMCLPMHIVLNSKNIGTYRMTDIHPIHTQPYDTSSINDEMARFVMASTGNRIISESANLFQQASMGHSIQQIDVLPILSLSHYGVFHVGTTGRKINQFLIGMDRKYGILESEDSLLKQFFSMLDEYREGLTQGIKNGDEEESSASSGSRGSRNEFGPDSTTTDVLVD